MSINIAENPQFQLGRIDDPLRPAASSAICVSRKGADYTEPAMHRRIRHFEEIIAVDDVFCVERCG